VEQGQTTWSEAPAEVQGSNLSHPGGNITGVSNIAPELAAKRLELIRDLLPKATLIGELVDSANTYWQRVRPDYEQAFRAQRMRPLFVEVADPAEIEKAIARIAGKTAEAVGLTVPQSMLPRGADVI
jgi:putative ABC transport system substrate-binding protein